MNPAPPSPIEVLERRFIDKDLTLTITDLDSLRTEFTGTLANMQQERKNALYNAAHEFAALKLQQMRGDRTADTEAAFDAVHRIQGDLAKAGAELPLGKTGVSPQDIYSNSGSEFVFDWYQEGAHNVGVLMQKSPKYLLPLLAVPATLTWLINRYIAPPRNAEGKRARVGLLRRASVFMGAAAATLFGVNYLAQHYYPQDAVTLASLREKQKEEELKRIGVARQPTA